MRPFGKPATDPDRPRRIGRWARSAAIALIVWAVVAPLAAWLLIVRREPLKGDALIVLSGSPVYRERLRHAAALYGEGRASAIVLTNDGLRGPWSPKDQRNLRSPERALNLLGAAGVPTDRLVVLPQRVHSTYDEALAVQAYARSRGIRRLVIVTSPYHARRALWTFTRVLGEDGIAVGIDPVPAGDQSPTPGLWWLTAAGWRNVAAEYPKFLYYVVAYR